MYLPNWEPSSFFFWSRLKNKYSFKKIPFIQGKNYPKPSNFYISVRFLFLPFFFKVEKKEPPWSVDSHVGQKSPSMDNARRKCLPSSNLSRKERESTRKSFFYFLHFNIKNRIFFWKFESNTLKTIFKAHINVSPLVAYTVLITIVADGEFDKNVGVKVPKVNPNKNVQRVNFYMRCRNVRYHIFTRVCQSSLNILNFLI